MKRKGRLLLVLLLVCLFMTGQVKPVQAQKKSDRQLKAMRTQTGALDSVLLQDNIIVYSSYMYTNAELKMLTCIIEAEAGNQPYKGKVAVGNVVLNRVDSVYYPGSIKGVIFRKNQFQPTRNGAYQRMMKNYNKDSAMLRSCKKAAKAALSGVNYVGDRDGFCTPAAFRSTNSVYAAEGSILKIGDHVFYKNRR